MIFAAVLFRLQETIQTETITRKDICGCPIRASGSNTDRDNYKKRYLWLSFSGFRKQYRQRKLQEMIFVVVFFILSKAIQTEITMRNEVCGCTFRTSRDNSDRENYD